ncbi:hypothetical protein METBIDRAFT_192518 [Metschnikowia bicuspidata var. bicuspidata NRRL YB-4993]|uniref:Uncharacterized protein n=1 Tax=Metschnikowia bicuspidata var. bicuspidata NRRL YB-4993 TaxID=869754 RepID=A0A1A0H849_9ASCO|nr:hypothetical protein METBIDRAFT_192518 [Metschnikowia bicuspidata var. bicuspidata NRRL YB-4993]OBA20196.1 hypothetical protein METBIDRAFT_192518 [Metschnikowia bicuspidata var. bicuspidata NRRL YB-4993]
MDDGGFWKSCCPANRAPGPGLSRAGKKKTSGHPEKKARRSPGPRRQIRAVHRWSARHPAPAIGACAEHPASRADLPAPLRPREIYRSGMASRASRVHQFCPTQTTPRHRPQTPQPPLRHHTPTDPGPHPDRHTPKQRHTHKAATRPKQRKTNQPETQTARPSPVS